MKTSNFILIAITAVTTALFAISIHQDNVREEETKQQIQQGLGKHTNIRDLGIIDGCHVKHYIIDENKLVSGEVKNSYDTFYVADCNGTETTTQKVGGKFQSDEAVIKRPKMR